MYMFVIDEQGRYNVYIPQHTYVSMYTGASVAAANRAVLVRTRGQSPERGVKVK